MVLVLVIVLVAAVRAHDISRVDCVEYCLSLTSDKMDSNECDCNGIVSERREAEGSSKAPELLQKPQSEPQAAKSSDIWPGLLPMPYSEPQLAKRPGKWPIPAKRPGMPAEDSTIFYQPAQRISGPGISLLDQPFYILNPAFKISFNPPEKDTKKRTANKQFKENGDVSSVSSTDNDPTKGPIYLDIEFADSDDSERAAFPQLSFSKPLKENDLSDCIDLHILAYSRDKKNTTSISELSSKSLALYGNLSDSEIRKEIERKCSHANSLVKDSIKEIKDKRPKKKINAPIQGTNGDKVASESKYTDSEEAKTRPIDLEDISTAESTRSELYSLPTKLTTLPVDYGDNLSNASKTVLENQIKEFFQPLSNTSETTTIASTTQFIPTTNKFERNDKNNEKSSTEDTSPQYQTKFGKMRADSTTTSTENPKIEKLYPKSSNDLYENVYDVIPTTNTANDSKYAVNKGSLDNLIYKFNVADTSFNSEDLSKEKPVEKENSEDNDEGLSSVTVPYMKLPAEDLTTEDPVNMFYSKKSNIPSAPENDTNDSRILENQPIDIQKIVTKELPNNTVISDAKGIETDPLLYNDFNDDKFSDNEKVPVDKPRVDIYNSETDKQDNETIISEIAGDLYFNFKDVNIPARFVQNSDGKIIVGIDGTSFCDKLPFNSNKELVLFSKLCEYVSGSINVPN